MKKEWILIFVLLGVIIILDFIVIAPRGISTQVLSNIESGIITKNTLGNILNSSCLRAGELGISGTNKCCSGLNEENKIFVCTIQPAQKPNYNSPQPAEQPVIINNIQKCTADSDCSAGKKCFECHGLGIIPQGGYTKYCHTDQEISAMRAQCAAM